jgi:hypothetical protein
VRLRIWGHGKENRIECLTAVKTALRGERRIVVDRHGNLVQMTNVGSNCDNRIIVLDKASTDFDSVFNASFGKPWIMPYELAEAGLLRVLVIDERIVQNALKPFDEIGGNKEAFRRAFTGKSDLPPTVWHVARRAGVHVATHIVITGTSDDRKSAFDVATHEWAGAPSSSGFPWLTVKVTVPAWAGDSRVSEGGRLQDSRHRLGIEISNNCDGPLAVDLVIIHQGVADCLNDKQPNLGRNFLNALAEQYWLIVESGRGIPPEVEETNHKFLTFSAIERVFRGGRVAKLALTRMIMSVTRSKKTGPIS